MLSETCVGWCCREQKYAPQKCTVITELIFSFLLSHAHVLWSLLSLTGAEKDLLWYLVFVERDQQARTGSLQSSPDRRAPKWAVIPQTAVTRIALLNHLHHNHQHQQLPLHCCTRLSRMAQKHEGAWMHPSVMYCECTNTWTHPMHFCTWTIDVTAAGTGSKQPFMTAL